MSVFLLLSVLKCVCVCVSQVEQLEAGTPGRLKVTAKSTETDEIIEGEYNTVCESCSLPCYFFAVYEYLQIFTSLVLCLRY